MFVLLHHRVVFGSTEHADFLFRISHGHDIRNPMASHQSQPDTLTSLSIWRISTVAEFTVSECNPLFCHRIG
jgi:hypothetical protein